MLHSKSYKLQYIYKKITLFCLIPTVNNAFQFASIIHWISLAILSVFFTEVSVCVFPTLNTKTASLSINAMLYVGPLKYTDRLIIILMTLKWTIPSFTAWTNWNHAAVEAGIIVPSQVIHSIYSTNTLKCRWSLSVPLVLNNSKASGVLYWLQFSLQPAAFVLVPYIWPSHC